MIVRPVFLVSPVYYPAELSASVAASLLDQIRRIVPAGVELADPVHLSDQAGVDAWLSAGHPGVPLLIALSGATQPWLLSIAKASARSLLWWHFPGGGIFDEAGETLVRTIVSRNALPAVMDCWAHLRNRKVPVERVFDAGSFAQRCGVAAAIDRIRATRLLIIGYTQSWVVSASVDERRIDDRFGIRSVHIGLEELFAEYAAVPRGPEVAAFAADYLQAATACVEPRTQHVEDAYRLYMAIRNLMDRYACNAVAISCFSLVRQLRVTSCIALSLLNDQPGTVAACEGDLDAAVSMIVGKAVSGLPVFMGNPVYYLDDRLDLVHCTAPRRLTSEAQSYTVRTHHETGLSVAQRIEVDGPRKATLFRIGNEFSEATLFPAEFVDNPDEDTCRTQFRFRIDSAQKRIDESLGCHHMVIFADCVEELRAVFEGPLGLHVR
jgi:L-fucose isomerase-like protein